MRSRPASFAPSLLALGLAVGLTTTAGRAQDVAQLEAQLEQKLAEAWVKNSPWELDFAAAKRTAAERGVPIFAYFTRSYAP